MMCAADDDAQAQLVLASDSSRKEANEKEKKPWPEDRDDSVRTASQVFRRWTYSYMTPILRKGARIQRAKKKKKMSSTNNATSSTAAAAAASLSQDDLYDVPKSMEAAHLSELFRKHYQDVSDEASSSQSRKAVGKNRRLIVTLWRLAAPTFVPAGFCQLVTVLCQVALPLLVGGLLRVLEENPKQQVIQEGMPFAIAVFACTFINAFGNHRHRHLAMKSGIVMRAATVSVLYEHVLKLSPKGKRGLTTGFVTTLIATDTQKLFEVTQEGHLIWALPLSIVLVTICLLVVMGPTTLVGIAVLVLFVPLVERVTSSMLAIRKERVKMTDKRVGIVSSLLQGIKVTKLNVFEENYAKRVSEARREELVFLRKELAVWALTLVLMVISPMMATASTFAVYVLVDENNILTASISFSVLLLFSALRFPINFAGRLLGKATQAYSAAQRIARFLEREVRDDNDESPMNNTTLQLIKNHQESKDALPLQTGGNPGDLSTDDEETTHELTKTPEENPPLQLENAAFYIESVPDEESTDAISFQVSSFDGVVRRGEVLAICGPVGGGKSVLVNGIIDETAARTGTVVRTSGQVAYVPQGAFILNATLRENILFGRVFKEDLYNRVLDACSLRPDIELLGSMKDLTEIGERGVTLSGGQKQRVSLARAAYAQPDIVLLDDPLSALDAGTSKRVFDRLIKGRDALFSNAAVVFVTHASHLLNRVDKIIVIVEGENKFSGSWDELLSFRSEDENTKTAVDFIRTSVQEEESGKIDGDNSKESLSVDKRSNADAKADALMTVEEREHGLSSLSTWLLWFKYAGGFVFLSLQIIFMAIDRFAYVSVEYWLARWTDGADSSIEAFGIEFPPQTDGRSAQYKYLAVFASILLVSVLSTILRSEWSVTGGARAAKRTSEGALERVLGAPMSYFESTPMGRILNRFTYDLEVIDVTLTQTMSMFLISCSWYVAGICVMIVIIPWMALVIFPVTLIYWLLLLHYRKSGSDLQRIDALSRSPLQALLSEGLDGAPSIRVYGKYFTFVGRFYDAVNVNSAALLSFVTAQRWLGLRIELLGTVVVLAASLLIICLNGILQIDAGLVGLLILWSSNFTITLGFLVDTFAEAEAAITAIERVDAMSQIPQEKSRVTDEKFSPPESWPCEGRLEFDRVCLRYRKGLPLALDELSFTIAAGLKVGVVGRTGAGKSSITVALFRLVEIESGQIRLDGLDLGQLGLSDVRGRGMAIIPQDPFLAGSTLRECIDPFAHNTDADILEALKSVRLASSRDTTAMLDDVVEEGGLNYSVGERQLLNLARALLSKPKLLVLDEATASIDGERDAFIQDMLRTKFKDSTLITVAHRLHTIMDYDAVLVMDAGRAVEFGPPGELLQANGIFAELVDATGPEGSKALRAMVQTHPSERKK